MISREHTGNILKIRELESLEAHTVLNSGIRGKQLHLYNV